jgi:flagellar assembly factor FliW
METNTKYFGTIPYTEEEVITFENGIFGFEEQKRYLLIRFEEDNAGLLCLQNLEDAQLAFIVANPFVFLPDYNPQVAEADLKKLGNPAPESLAFYTTCVLAEDMSRSTTNLRCPLVINGETKQAVQVILEDTAYGFKQPFHELIKEK